MVEITRTLDAAATEQFSAWLLTLADAEDRCAESALAMMAFERKHATKRWLEREAAQHREKAEKFRAAAALLAAKERVDG